MYHLAIHRSHGLESQEVIAQEVIPQEIIPQEVTKQDIILHAIVSKLSSHARWSYKLSSNSKVPNGNLSYRCIP